MIMQTAMSKVSSSNDGRPLIHGRQDVVDNAAPIRVFGGGHELIVAASIAHQASDFKDRPYGRDEVERLQKLVKQDASIGIAQIRPSELKWWAPDLVGQGQALFDPAVSTYVMSQKIAFADFWTQWGVREDIGLTDRYMLMAITQNATSPQAIMGIVSRFTEKGMQWSEMLKGNEGETRQVRYVALHMIWLLEQGYHLPEGLDMEYWLKNAFSDIEGVDYDKE
ncbi:MAG: hypothetical protein SXV54_00260 [Chloroflexota bacterium]|nr:hypothetical protein [Chloroflexota bacterium]